MLVTGFRSFIIALQFLSRLPTPALSNVEDRDMGRSLFYYPLVGLVLGLLLLLVSVLLGQVLPATAASLQAALVLAVWVLLTGALHLDGLADSADAWLGGHGDRQRSLEIMKDPRCGPAAVVILVLLLLLKFAALEQLLQAQNHLSLVVAPLMARASLLLLFQTTPYVREQGLGSLLAQYYDNGVGGVILTGVVLALLVLLGWQGVVIVLLMIFIFLALRYLMLQRLGGFTGDTAGAQVEVMEMTVLAGMLLSV